MSDSSASRLVAWLFPGQGSQIVGMGKALYEAHEEVRQLYDTADRLLGYSISGLCFSGPADELQQTNNAQPALLITELAHLAALRLRYPGEYSTARFVAGHSLGEYTAFVVAGAISFEGALKLVAERGRLMQAAGSAQDGPTGMSAIIGLPDQELGAVCHEAGVDLANINAPGQVVISGPLQALEKAAVIAREHGARRVIPLQVSAAFHSRWMRPMAQIFAQHIRQAHFTDQENGPQIEVIANVTARSTANAQEVRELLEKQTYSPVRWVESVEYMAAQGVRRFVEVGPGKVLSGLVKRIDSEAEVLTSEELLA